MLKCWTVEPAEAPIDSKTVAATAVTDAKMVLSMRVLLTLVFLLEPAHGGQLPARSVSRSVPRESQSRDQSLAGSVSRFDPPPGGPWSPPHRSHLGIVGRGGRPGLGG